MNLSTSHTQLKLPEAFRNALCQPGAPTVPIRVEGDEMVCDVASNRTVFPIVDGTPILIDEDRSIFNIADYIKGRPTTMDLRHEKSRNDNRSKRFKRSLNKFVPSRSRSVTKFSSELAMRHIREHTPNAKILVIGAGDARFSSDGNDNLVYSDVALAPDTHIIADAHDVPFVDNTFDAVFAISVLEHVMDPYRVVSEIQRVLKPDGHVYAVTPFMQQVHMGPFDVTRFSHVGHRRLFRWFDEIRSGISNGPGMTVAWSIEYLLSSCSENPRSRSLLRTLSRFISWPFLLLDGWLAGKRGSYDCASAFFFFGKLRQSPISDREVIACYRGMNR